MSSLHLRHDHLLLDTCCIINLHETGFMSAILRCLPAAAVVVEDVRLEVKSLDLEPYIAEGVVLLDDFVGSEYNLSLQIAADIDLENGEVAVGAVAISRSWAIATDERRARNYFQQRAPKLQLISTPELLNHWASTAKPSPDTLRSALRSIEQQGRFIPGPQHSHYKWWRNACDD